MSDAQPTGKFFEWKRRLVTDGHIPLLGNTERGLLMALEKYVDRNLEAWPANETLARDVGVGERQIRRARRALADANLLKILDEGRGRGRSPKVRLTMPENRTPDARFSEEQDHENRTPDDRFSENRTSENRTSANPKPDILRPENRTFCDRAYKEEQPKNSPENSPLSSPPAKADGGAVEEGAEKGAGSSYEPAKPQRMTHAEADATIYAAFPRKVGRPSALKAIANAAKRLEKEGVDKPRNHLLRQTRAYAAAVQPLVDLDPAAKQYVPHPATWFNGGRYDDDPDEWTVTLNRGTPSRSHGLADYDPTEQARRVLARRSASSVQGETPEEKGRAAEQRPQIERENEPEEPCQVVVTAVPDASHWIRNEVEAAHALPDFAKLLRRLRAHSGGRGSAIKAMARGHLMAADERFRGARISLTAEEAEALAVRAHAELQTQVDADESADPSHEQHTPAPSAAPEPDSPTPSALGRPTWDANAKSERQLLGRLQSAKATRDSGATPLAAQLQDALPRSHP